MFSVIDCERLDGEEDRKLHEIKRFKRSSERLLESNKKRCETRCNYEIFYAILFNYRECDMDDFLLNLFVRFEHRYGMLIEAPRRTLESIGMTLDDVVESQSAAPTIYGGDEINFKKDFITRGKDMENIIKNTIYTPNGMGEKITESSGRGCEKYYRKETCHLYVCNDIIGDKRREGIKMNMPPLFHDELRGSVNFIRNAAENLLNMESEVNDHRVLLIKKFTLLFIIGVDESVQHQIRHALNGKNTNEVDIREIIIKNNEMLEYLSEKAVALSKVGFSVNNIETVVSSFVLEAAAFYNGCVNRSPKHPLHKDIPAVMSGIEGVFM